MATNLVLFIIDLNIVNLIPIIIQVAVLLVVLSKMKIQIVLIRVWAVLVLLSSLTKWISWLLQMKEDVQILDFDSFNIIVNFIGLILPIYFLMFLSESTEIKAAPKAS